ncbi:hypothetical protein FHU33_2876 [Blastococcus colisei]|uniref:Histidine kinase-like protein n=1 Tax=Blastococcus colisei TaxID=1564162 RepID=A0A543PH69_9ACTN|nr:hypothetical protein [Blastococcus colisei]TQN43431.1 hypothetical protein FHU33_2876 [Blastococcus colisei]
MARLPSGFTVMWHRDPTQLVDLPSIRASIRAFLADDDAPVVPFSDWVEQLVLVIDEITSDALRHGAVPVHLRLRNDSDHRRPRLARRGA